MRVHLVDGTFELFRCFFGAPPHAGKDGGEVGAVRGLVSTLSSLIADNDNPHVAVAFDTVIESFRNELFAGYKTSAGIDPNLWRQFPLAEAACRALGLVTWSMVEFEADDALATFAGRAAADADVEQVIICSPDKDLCQCVIADRVVTYDRIRKTRLDEAGVVNKHGVQPVLIPDYLALVGDTADGIPGLSGFGEKSSAKLLAHYGPIERFVDEAWPTSVRGAEKLRATFFANQSEARLYKTLATLRTDVPLTETTASLRYRGPDITALESLADVLADQGLVKRTRERLSAFV